MSGTLGKRYTFGEWQLDTRLYELRCSGKPVKLEPKVYDVLLYLIEHRDHVVSTQELMEQLWPGQFSGDAAVVRCVVAARRSIGDDGRAQRCIKTLRNRGYRFVATVQEFIDTTLAEGHQVVPSASASRRQQVAPLSDSGAHPEAMTGPERPGLCPQCRHKNSVTASFCGACGTRLAPICPDCGNPRSLNALFCTACGKSFTHVSAISDLPAAMVKNDLSAPQAGWDRSLALRDAESPAERRHLTVLFCDVINATSLAVRLDPEVYHQVIGAYHAVCVKVIERFDGHIAQYLGDGVLVYFGYPRAHEDDAQRAVRAGLGIIEALKPLQKHLQQEQNVNLAVRVGMHTGLVVVGDIGEGARHERLALGQAPNLAARLQTLAAPDTVLVSATTERLIHGWFICESLGNQVLKGFPEPMPVYRVLAESGIQSRLDLVVASGLTPLIGRGQEVELLLERWEHSKEGLGQVVLLSGEAGIGKSRLLHAVQEGLVGESYVQLECRGSPYAQHSALHPIIDLASRLLQWQREEPPHQTMGKLEAALVQYDVSLPEVIPLLASLLSLPLPERYAPLQLTPRQQKQKTLEVILTLLLTQAARQPVLFIVEDVHWIDPSTLDLLTLLVDQGPTARILTVLTSRPEFHPPWGFRAHVTTLTLGRLAPTQVEQMIDCMTAGKRFPSEVHQQVVAKTDGVPLFVEELTKMVLESGLLHEQGDRYELLGPLPSLAIPETLHDSLMARLDRLPDAKEVAQLGATLGRGFRYELLRAVSAWDEERLRQALAQLVEAELLHQRGVEPHVTYVFKHALIQETAYQSLLRSKRQQYLRQTVTVLEQHFPDIAETQPELLAYYCTEAGLTKLAVPYWLRAGERATMRSANVEAVHHLMKGLELLATSPETTESMQLELTLSLALGSPLMITKGQAAPEVGQLYTHALELGQRVGDQAHQFAALKGLVRFHNSAGRFRIACEMAEQGLQLAQRVHDQALCWEAHLELGATLFFLGDPIAARLHLERGLALYAPERHDEDVFRSGAHPQAFGLSHLAWTLWQLGFPDLALNRSEEALALAKHCSHPYVLARALHYAASVHQFRRETASVLTCAAALIALAQEHGFTRYLGRGMVMQGWGWVEQGAAEEGLEQLRQGIAVCRSVADEAGLPVFLASLAEACGRMGQPKAGLHELDEALTVAYKTQELRWEAELYRLKGELLLQASGLELHAGISRLHTNATLSHCCEVEALFQRALEVARRQQARSLELRVGTSLSRLWVSQGKAVQALQLLSGIYTCFTEGFDTHDLREAGTLLRALS
jgi:class 3 adenylate cyclase/DNA-binding winged helix-turn-helix (wHTH) protein/tetratricopeptide (TPR) repeat protein